MATINKALAKYSIGDGLTGPELDLLLERFTRMESDLGDLTRHYKADFGLAYRAVLRDLQTLHSFKIARERK